MQTSGTLFIVATPVGNIGDITYRAVEILKEADFIACEDTRITSRLLNHYEIETPLFVMSARNEDNKIKIISERLSGGESCALVSDAGTPCISDPGVRLVNAVIAQGIKVVPVPGANAAIAALSVCGLPTDSFYFEGFLPQKKGRQKKLKELAELDKTIVLYESVYRVEKLLNELNEYMPGRIVSVHREITKMFEETRQGLPAQLLESFDEKTNKGEFVIIIAPENWEQKSVESHE